MEQFLSWLEGLRLSTEIAGSNLLYPSILAAHGVGMAIVVGLNAAISLGILGALPQVPLPAMTKFYPAIWIGFGINAFTGLLLTMSAATRVLVDPVFYFKLVFITLALVNLVGTKREILGSHDAAGGDPPASSRRKLKAMAISALVLWAFAVTAGRMMGYTFFRFWD
jgi:hypothetical protein